MTNDYNLLKKKDKSDRDAFINIYHREPTQAELERFSKWLNRREQHHISSSVESLKRRVNAHFSSINIRRV